MAFVKPTSLAALPEEAPPPYSSGYTPAEEQTIRKLKEALELRDLVKEPVTLEEFRTIVIPWIIIDRTEAFVLNPEKIKVAKAAKVPKEPGVKAPRVKKPTKKELQDRYIAVAMNVARGAEISAEDMEFYNNY